jgi:hypothetical protein
MSETLVPADGNGVVFPVVNGRRSSQDTARGVFADATRGVAPELASAIDATKSWHRDYVRFLAEVERVVAQSPKHALAVAADGTFSLHERMRFVRDGDECELTQAIERYRDDAFTTTSLRGEADHPGRLAIPYRGQELSGDALHRQLDLWVGAGVIERSCAEALRLVDANPEWLDASDLTIALVGAAAEMSPLPALCRWGATVVAVDLPRAKVWQRIADAANAGCGTVHAPQRTDPAGDTTGRKRTDPAGDTTGSRAGSAPDAPGADLLTDLPELSTWLERFGPELVLGNYTYADGAAFVRVATAADALTTQLIRAGAASAVAYLASPTDVFAVSAEIVEATHAGKASIKRRGRVVGPFLRTASGGRLFAPNYQVLVDAEDGQRFGLADTVVPQQGPNYALAKRLQRWRALLSRETVLTSANVAPATRTRSVTNNRILAAAYAGAARYGVEVFDVATSSTLMAALLIHDLRNPAAVANPRTELPHPLTLFTDNAAHGGLWRLPWEPRSVLPLAAVEGLLRPTRR